MDTKILKEAMEDAKMMKETAFESAKNVLVEALSPKIKKAINESFGGNEFDLSSMGEADMYEAEDENDEVVPEVEPEDEEEKEEETLTFEAKEDEDEKEDEEVEEVVEITEDDLREAFSEVLESELIEATVTKNFGDVDDPNTHEGPGGTGIADEKSGESHWKDVDPPAAEDWTVKEAAMLRHMARLKKENKALKVENSSLEKAAKYLSRQLKETNLFNQKLLHTSKILQSNRSLSKKHQISIIEAFDRAQTLREVQLTYNAFQCCQMCYIPHPTQYQAKEYRLFVHRKIRDEHSQD